MRWVNVPICHISAQVTKKMVVPGTEEGIPESSEEINLEEVEADNSDEDKDD